MFLFLNFIQYSSQIVFYFTQSARKAVAKYKLLFKQHIGYNDKFEPRKQDVQDAQLSSDEDGLWMTYRLQEGEITIVKLNEDLTVKVRFKLSCAVCCERICTSAWCEKQSLLSCMSLLEMICFLPLSNK